MTPTAPVSVASVDQVPWKGLVDQARHGTGIVVRLYAVSGLGIDVSVVIVTGATAQEVHTLWAEQADAIEVAMASAGGSPKGS